MGSGRNHRIDRTETERLIVGDQTPDRDLARLLAAAAGPGPSGRMAGEDAVTAMWHEARQLAGDRPVVARSASVSGLRRLLTVKIIAVLLALGVGSVALAASTGVLPGPFGGVHPGAHPSGSGTAVHPSSRPSARPGGTTSAPSMTPSPSLAPGSSAVNTEALYGLCHAYAAAIRAGHATVLDKPAYAGLIAAAGGRSQVAAFCDALTGGAPDGSHGPGATHPAKTPPTGTPGESTGHPGGGSGGHG